MLTKRLVDAATLRQTEYQLFDGEIPGLALRVHPNASKVYALFYRNSTGRKRTLTLGRHGAITPGCPGVKIGEAAERSEGNLP